MKPTIKFALPMVLMLGLGACVSDDESVPPVPPGNATFKALYAPLGGIMPFPNDLFFSGSTDGTLNIPVADADDVSDYLNAYNALDGYSTTAPIFVPFSGAVDGGSISATTVRMYNITNPMAPVPLTYGTAFTAAVSPALDGTNNLMVTPLTPLTPKNRYMVLVRTGITSGGVAAVPDATMQTLLDCHGEGATPDCTPPAQLASVWGAVNGLFDLANALGTADADIAVVASFLTQSTTDVMTKVNTDAVAGAVAGATFVANTNTLVGGAGYADVYQGVISVPYYLSSTAPLTGRWKTASDAEVTRYTVAAGAGPAATSTPNIPILIAVPNATSPGYGTGKPVAGWPVIVFQHGITGNRTNMLGMADAAAAAGFAVVAIDQPLHGVTSGPLSLGTLERTFGDLSDNTTRAPGPDGIADTSGQNYINLSSLLTSRDNLRQSAADLIRVAKTVGTIDYDAGGADFDASRVHFVGHSLGAIVGTTFLAVNTDVQAATLGMPGGTIARLLRDSPTFSTTINAGLAANGVVNGSQLYEQFMQAAQTAVDSGDAINFGAAANANHALHLIQVVGTSTATQDQVVPNSATARLIAAMGLAKRSTVGAFANTEGYVNFTAGHHSSLLTPTGSAAAFSEMQTQMATWMGSNGAAFTIADGSVIEP